MGRISELDAIECAVILSTDLGKCPQVDRVIKGEDKSTNEGTKANGSAN